MNDLLLLLFLNTIKKNDFIQIQHLSFKENKVP